MSKLQKGQVSLMRLPGDVVYIYLSSERVAFRAKILYEQYYSAGFIAMLKMVMCKEINHV